ncbi:hypothetical protein V7S43_015425 [Phytophthora oleae]|uniref:Uncharacterized protein n=1 Tax=Phytophthora oleae TaxID=2107226 RepID=A0ABD3F191_9STRA
MNSPTPTPSSAAVLTSTAASNMATGKISVPEYFALQKEKQQAKPGSAVIDPKELFGFGDEIPLDYDDEELANEEGELEDKAPVPVSSSRDTHDPPLGSRRPSEEAPDASSSKRPRSDEEASPCRGRSLLRALIHRQCAIPGCRLMLRFSRGSARVVCRTKYCCTTTTVSWTTTSPTYRL